MDWLMGRIKEIPDEHSLVKIGPSEPPQTGDTVIGTVEDRSTRKLLVLMEDLCRREGEICQEEMHREADLMNAKLNDSQIDQENERRENVRRALAGIQERFKAVEALFWASVREELRGRSNNASLDNISICQGWVVVAAPKKRNPLEGLLKDVIPTAVVVGI